MQADFYRDPYLHQKSVMKAAVLMHGCFRVMGWNLYVESMNQGADLCIKTY